MKIGMIWAQSRNGVIGNKGQLPWHLPEDLAHFKRITQGHPVIMGRKTWDSLPPKFRPLPGRRNYVITRQTGPALEALRELGAHTANSLEDALAQCRAQVPRPSEVWVIGGAQIYAQAEALANWAQITWVGMDATGDAIAPKLNSDWVLIGNKDEVSKSGISLAFHTYSRQHQSL